MFRRFFIQILIFSFFISFEAGARFQAKFYGGTWKNPNTNDNKVNSGTLFKTGLVAGNVFRYGGSFAYSQGTTSDRTLVQGDLCLGLYIYPMGDMTESFFQISLYFEGGGQMSSEEKTGSGQQATSKSGASYTIGVGLDTHLFQSFGLNFNVENHNTNQFRMLVGFFQNY